jgi:hypothetical protein
MTSNACRACARLLVLDLQSIPESLGDDILIDDTVRLQTS